MWGFGKGWWSEILMIWVRRKEGVLYGGKRKGGDLLVFFLVVDVCGKFEWEVLLD